ncbi:hypothetical protein REPUB_Repub01dG0257600 [Reevesia pubescens]
MAQAIKMFSKSLTDTDIKKRLAIPAKVLPAFSDFSGSHAVIIHLMYGTRVWPIVCSIRKKGHKKPVFSGGWRNFVICNNFNVGDRLTLYKVQDEDGSSHYRVEVEKPASRPSGVLISSPALSLNHDQVDENSVTRKVLNFEHEQEQLPKAPIILEEAIMEPSDAFVGHVIAKQPIKIFGANVGDEATIKADHFKNEQETEMKLFGITKGIGMGEPPLPSYYMTKEERETESFGLTNGGAIAYGTTSRTEKLSLDLVMGQLIGISTPYTGVVNLDLTLAPPQSGIWMQDAGVCSLQNHGVTLRENEECYN